MFQDSMNRLSVYWYPTKHKVSSFVAAHYLCQSYSVSCSFVLTPRLHALHARRHFIPQLVNPKPHHIPSQFDQAHVAKLVAPEQFAIPVRWDLVSNDAYGRSPGMDALPDIKQLQQETRRKAQAIDKMVNPPFVADVQLKNQPASLLPGGITYVSGYSASGKPGFSSVYDTKFPVGEITEDLNEVRERLKRNL